MPKITTEQAIDAFNKILNEIKGLYDKDVETGHKAQIEIERRLLNTVKLAFDDAQDKITAYNRMGRIIIRDPAISNAQDPVKAKFDSNVQMIEGQVQGYLDELKLLREFEQQSSKLDKTGADIEKARKEAERRGYVTESKVYGAAIEIIDRLRDELKGRTDYTKEIAALKAEIADLRDKLYLLAEDQRVDLDILQAERDEDIRRAKEEDMTP